MNGYIRVGVAVSFFVKKVSGTGCQIFYEAVRDYAKSDEKRDFLKAKSLWNRQFQEIRPDAKHNWINQTDNNFDILIPIASKEVKAANKLKLEKAIFKLFGNGVNTARDE